LKIPGIAESIFQQYYDLCIEFLHNTRSPQIQAAVLKLIEMFLMVFPKGMNSKLQEIRDITRTFLISKEREVRDVAFDVYPLIFRSVLPTSAKMFEEFLKNEINLLQKIESTEAKADPLICYLTINQLQSIILLI
jgi:hypothetical protein